MQKKTWEPVKDDGLPSAGCKIRRSKVPGGWLIYVHAEDNDPECPYAYGGLTFYPDPKHEWNGGSTP
jgi:hypothetical protein